MWRTQEAIRVADDAPARNVDRFATARRSEGSRRPRLTHRHVDVVLEVLLTVALASGFASWTIGTGWVRWATGVHAASGLTVLILSGSKLRGSVRTGMRRGRATRWVSVGFGLLVLATVALGLLHATGLWSGVGVGTAMWTHTLLGVVVAPVLAWHVVSRPSRPRIADLDRRAVLGAGVAVAAGTGLVLTQEVGVRLAGQGGAERRPTGSHAVGSFRPEAMPTVSWLDDQAPTTAAADWVLEVAGRPVDLAALRRRARPLEATVDCTGGWSSTQSWDAVPLGSLLGEASGRSIRVTSATGYSRLFPFADRDVLHLAVGYGGQPLRRGHGAPVRLVAPGRRGPWWVKWVTTVDVDDRPWWLQLPLPLE